MTTTWNQSLKEAKEEFYNLGLDIQTLTEKLLKQTDDIATQLNKVRKTLESPLISDKEKVEASLQIINRRNRSDSELRAEIDSLRGNYQTLNKDVVFAKILARKFRTISGKCKGIILNLTYCFDGSDKYLSAAIKNYIQYNGNVDLNMSPKGFLSKKELSILAMLDSDKVSLYKMYFFKYLSDGFKSGAINLNNAFEYTTLESNLITREFFNKNFDSILLQTGLNEIANIDDVLRQHELETNALFEQVNIAIERGSNSYVVAEDGGGYHTSPERNISLQDDLEEKKLELYPKTKLISIAEAISTVNSATQFLDAFEHIVHKHLKSKPENKMFFAAIMALGCNFGTRALAKHAEGINPTILKTTADAYFSVENIRNASDKILEFVDKLPVANLFRSEHAVHTSSDGQKWIVSYDSLNANFSFKYGGKDLVLSAYTFIDSRNLFFHSNVFSGAQYEAHYMIDGMLRNRVVKSKIHSTDTHGYTDAVFGLSHILGVSFAPRLRDVARRQLFSFEPRSKYRKKGYTVLPQGEIDKELIREQYKEILRIAASIKLGETSASQVFKRLNSYTPKNPLYRAIKEFGKIIKTKHILNYLDDPEYRTEITRQLNKGELGNKMDRAIAIGNPEYSEVLKDSQEQTESCRRLLKNVMVCWNYMHLSQLLIDSKSEKSKSKIIQRVLGV